MYDYVSRTVFIVVAACLAILMLAGGTFLYYEADTGLQAVERASSEAIEGLGEEIIALDDKVVTLETTRAAELQSELADIRAELEGVKANIANLVVDIGGLAELEEDLEGLREDLDSLETKISDLETTYPYAYEDVTVTVEMSPYKVIQSPGDYHFYVTINNRTEYAKYLHLKAVFTARTHTSTIQAFATKLTVKGRETSLHDYVPSLTNCAYMEFRTSLDEEITIVGAYSDRVLHVILTLAYTSGSAIWDYSFTTNY